MRPAKLRRSLGWIALPVVLPLVGAFCIYSATGRDDSYITNWVAERLADHGDLINYNGERVEQSSSLLHVVVVATARRLTGLPTSTLGVALSALFGGVAIWLAHRFARRMDEGISIAVAWLVATVPGLLYWSLSGLETTLATCTMVAVGAAHAIPTEQGRLKSLGGWLAATFAYLSVRPEAPLVLGAALGGSLIVLAARRWRARTRQSDTILAAARLRLEFVRAVLALGAAGLLLIWRHAYFGAWFPQPVSAKSTGFTLASLRSGWAYFVAQGPMGVDGALWVLAPIAALVILWRALREPRAASVELSAALILGAGLAFIVLSGGDWMESARFLVPVAPLAAICTVSGLHYLGGRRLANGIVIVMVVLQVAVTWRFARESSPGGPVWAAGHIETTLVGVGASWVDVMHRGHYRDLICSQRLLEAIRKVRERTGRPVTIMSGQMGVMAYRAASAEFGHVRLIDRLGLISRDFTDCAATRGLVRRPVGLGLVYEDFFAQRDTIRRLCALGDPDIIYDLETTDGRRERLFEANGYRVVYQQRGPIRNGSAWIPGAIILGEELVAVREDLVDAAWPRLRYVF